MLLCTGRVRAGIPLLFDGVATQRSIWIVLRRYGDTPIVRHVDNDTLKPVRWVGSSNADLKRFPDSVRRRIGFAVYQAQAGFQHRDAKPLKGFGSGVLEVVTRHDGDAFRAVYTVRFEAAVYVLHAFQKKSRRGIRTPKRELDLIARRLNTAERHYRETLSGQ